MFRTRDFVLIFCVVVFLVVAIGVTLFGEYNGFGNTTSSVSYIETEDREYVAVLDEKKPLSRSEHLADMRRKVADSGSLVFSAPETVTTETTDVDIVIEANDPSKAVAQKCPGYSVYSVPWSPQGVVIEQSEGARIVYRTDDQLVAGSTTISRSALLQLPMYPVRSESTCLSSDVVGVAHDGSLIRNTEVGLYGVFGEQTLIGYALDGFPIYGVSDRVTDECGGTLVAGEYHYYLSDGRESVLNCFAAKPTSL